MDVARVSSAKQLLALLLLLPLAAGQQPIGGWVACNAVIPAAPRLLLAQSLSEGRVELGWMPPSNRPCSVVYEVSVYAAGADGVSLSAVTALNVTQQPASVTGLKPGVQYTFSGISPEGGGAAAHVTATPHGPTAPLSSSAQQPPPTVTVTSGIFAAGSLGGWSCKPEASYQACDAGKAGLCAPVNCAQLAKTGLCDSPMLKPTDWVGRTVTQHCAAECGCQAVPVLRQTLAPPAADWCCAFRTAQYFAGGDGHATNGL